MEGNRRQQVTVAALAGAAGAATVGAAVIAAGGEAPDLEVLLAVGGGALVASVLPLRWVTDRDATVAVSASSGFVALAATLVSTPVLVLLCAVVPVLSTVLLVAYGNGVNRPAPALDALLVSTAFVVLPGGAAGLALDAAGATSGPAAVLLAGAVFWAASNALVCLLLLSGPRRGRRRGTVARHVRASLLVTGGSLAAAAAISAVVADVGVVWPVLVTVPLLVVLWRQAVALHRYRTITVGLLDLVSAAAESEDVEAVVGLVADAGARVLGRPVELRESRPATRTDDGVAVVPVGEDGRWELVVGRGELGRRFSPGPHESRALDGLARAAGVAVSAARSRARLRYEATVDEVSGLLNRRGFTRDATRMIERAGTEGRSVTLAYVDLDGLKRANDTHGHEAGDEAIVAAGDALRDQLRPEDVTARLGGDEFAVLFSDPVDGDAATARLDAAFSALPHEVGASVGAVVGAAEDGLDALLRLADERMYAVKRTRPGHRALEVRDSTRRDAELAASSEPPGADVPAADGAPLP